MPVAGTRVTLATMLGAADALVVESVEEDVAVLSEGPGLHPGAKASTRTYDGERVWHLTFVVLERHEITPGQARVELCLHDRHLLGEERRLPRVACRLAATARRAGDPRASVWARVLDVSQGGLALRTAVVLRRRRPDRRRARRRHRRGHQRARRGRRPRGRRGRRHRTRPHRRRRRRRRPAPGRPGRPPARLAERRRAAARAAAGSARGARRGSPPAANGPSQSAARGVAVGAPVDRTIRDRVQTAPDAVRHHATEPATERPRTAAWPDPAARYPQSRGSELRHVGRVARPGITAVVSGLPAGLALDREAIRTDLGRRQAGYGRSPRQQIEQDDVEILGGVRHGLTLGGPLALIVRNRDHANWGAAMSAWPVTDEELAEVAARRSRKVQLPRPGHADLSGRHEVRARRRAQRARARLGARDRRARRRRRDREGPARAARHRCLRPRAGRR